MKMNLIKDESFLHVSRELIWSKGTRRHVPTTFVLVMGLKINFGWTMQIRRLKGSLNGFRASFYIMPICRPSPRARLNFHHISITSSSEWNQIRSFTTISGPLKRIMMHRIYDNLFDKNCIKKGTKSLKSQQQQKLETGKAIATLFCPIPAGFSNRVLGDEIEILYSFWFSSWEKEIPNTNDL